MAGFEPEEPEFSDDSEYCQAVRIGRYNQDAELTIFYTIVQIQREKNRRSSIRRR